MTDDIRAKAETAQKDVEAVASVRLPEVKGEIVEISAADPETQQKIRARMDEVDIHDTQSIIKFGAKAQDRLTSISGQMLEGVKSKDAGPAGESLREMVTAIRGFDVDELDPGRKLSWWERLIGKAQPVAAFIARYETVRGQIDETTDALLGHETTLLKDIKMLDKLYESSLEFYDELALYIAAGEAKIHELDTQTIVAKAAEVDTAPESERVMRAQQLRDLRAARDDLERRVHDLKLTRQVTMQSLPSIRLVQENDKGLVTKINSTLVNTVPLWQTQLAQSVAIFRSREAGEVVREATDLTNELLTKNAENLQEANREIRTQMERGVFDIEAVKAANQRLLDTIEDSLRIADEGKAKRAAAEAELTRMEQELKTALAAAKAKAAPAAEQGGE